MGALYRLRPDLDRLAMTRPGQVDEQVTRGGFVGLDRQHALELSCKPEREQSGAGEQLGHSLPLAGRLQHRRAQRLEQCTVRLRKDARRNLQPIARDDELDRTRWCVKADAGSARLSIAARAELHLDRGRLPGPDARRLAEHRFNLWRQHRAAVDGLELVRVCAPEPDPSGGHHDPRARSIAELLGRAGQTDGTGQSQPTDSFECIYQDGALRLELGLVFEMLPGTAAADAVNRAARVPARRAGPLDGDDLAARVARLALDDPDAQPVSGRREGNEDGAAIGQPTDTVAAGRESLDLDRCVRRGYDDGSAGCGSSRTGTLRVRSESQLQSESVQPYLACIASRTRARKVGSSSIGLAR